MPLDFDTLQLTTGVGPRQALVLTPRSDIIVADPPPPGQQGELTPTDRRVIEAARQTVQQTGATVCIFRGRAPGGDGAYRFAPDISEGQALRLAKSMLAGQLLVYREMVRLGVCLFIHTDFGPIEVEAFRSSVDLVAEELEALTEGDSAEAHRARLDLWMLRNLIFFFSLGFDKFVATILPDKLPLMEKRMERIRRMASKLER